MGKEGPDYLCATKEDNVQKLQTSAEGRASFPEWGGRVYLKQYHWLDEWWIEDCSRKGQG